MPAQTQTSPFAQWTTHPLKQVADTNPAYRPQLHLRSAIRFTILDFGSLLRNTNTRTTLDGEHWDRPYPREPSTQNYARAATGQVPRANANRTWLQTYCQSRLELIDSTLQGSTDGVYHYGKRSAKVGGRESFFAYIQMMPSIPQ